MEHDSLQTFGELLTHLRKRAQLTQAELARAVGYSREQIVRLEKNQRVPDRAVVAATFIPALDLDDVPELAQRLLELAGHTRQPRSNLPAQLTSFIGREAELSAVRGYLLDPDKRLITLIGPPGIGKTRLSLQVAHSVLNDFADGVFFVPLAAIADSDFVAQAITQSLGLVETDQRSLLARLGEGIGARQMLLVLDNFEHIIDAAPLGAELLRVCPNLKIVVTSRESLRVPGEWLYPMPSLTIPTEGQLKTMTDQVPDQFSALQLFAERARTVRPDFTLTPTNASTVAAICRQLDGLPLAIELIASRLRLMSPQALQTQLTGDFKLQADGMRGVPMRQKTLHNAIAWSYDRLSREEQSLLARLAVCAGGFTLEAAQAISQVPHVLNGVMSLLDKSLLVKTIDAQGEIRFSQLEMIRDFALDRLRDRNEEAAARDRHLAYFLDLAENGDSEMLGPHQIEWVERIEREYDNVHAALEWGVSHHQTESVLRLFCALGWIWEVRGHYGEAFRWLDEISALPDVNDYPLVYARVLNHIGRYYWTQERYREALALLEKSRDLSLTVGAAGERNLAEALNWMGLLFLDLEGATHRTKTLFEHGLELYQKWGDEQGVALNTFHLGILARNLNQVDLALALFERSLALFRQSGSLMFIARVSLNLGFLFLQQGIYDRAQHLLEQQLEIDQKLQFWNGIAEGWSCLSYLLRLQADYEQAGQFCEKSVVICQEHLPDRKDIFFSSGVIAFYLGNHALAFQRFSYVLQIVWRSEDRSDAGICLSGLAAVAGETHQPERAARLAGAARAMLETGGRPLPPEEAREFGRRIQIARDQLGETLFEALMAEGRALSLEQAIDLAL
jgi:predicted ATPase/DNA-binding XRE family transcriptional regulator